MYMYIYIYMSFHVKYMRNQVLVFNAGLFHNIWALQLSKKDFLKNFSSFIQGVA